MKDFFGDEKYKKIIIAFWVILGIAITVFAVIFMSFSRKLKNTADMGLVTINTTTSVVPNGLENNEMALSSTTSDKDINEVANEALKQVSNGVSGETLNISSKEEIKNTNKKTDKDIAKATESEENKAKVETSTKPVEEEKKELKFEAPTSGEIIVDYANESLVYSKTLEEWTTHLGVDIKANKASAVTAAEDGTIKSIKNDPRYGLTVTISHENGFKTIYSNLLTTEFVKENEQVEKGQTIGTVGESASFEIADEPHLHFEMYKDGEVVNPTIYLK